MKIQNLPRKFSVKTKQLRAQGAPSARTSANSVIKFFVKTKQSKISAKLKITEQSQELLQVALFHRICEDEGKKRRTWVLTRNEPRFLSFCLCRLTLITRFSRCSLLYIFFLWSETVKILEDTLTLWSLYLLCSCCSEQLSTYHEKFVICQDYIILDHAI